MALINTSSTMEARNAAEEPRTEEQFRRSDEGLYNWQFGKTRLRDMEPGYEAIHMIRKGQACGSAAGAKVGLLYRFIVGMFGIEA